VSGLYLVCVGEPLKRHVMLPPFPMQIRVTLDPENPPPLDPEETLGNIVITDETGSEIRQENIYVDDWLAALVNGVEALGRGEENFSAEIQSEANPILFESRCERLSLSFADTTLIGSFSAFRSDLRKAVQKILAAFEPDISFRPDSFWAQLQVFAG
jgi:hypothetical protein